MQNSCKKLSHRKEILTSEDFAYFSLMGLVFQVDNCVIILMSFLAPISYVLLYIVIALNIKDY